MKKLHVSLAALLAATCIGVQADDPKPEDVIHYRQSVYRIIYWNYKPITEMVRGKRAFDAAEVKKRAERVAAMSLLLEEAYAQGSDKGAQTEALPAIWENFDDFKSKLADFQREARTLSQVAAGGDATKVKEQLAKTTNSCKACHDKYRAD